MIALVAAAALAFACKDKDGDSGGGGGESAGGETAGGGDGESAGGETAGGGETKPETKPEPPKPKPKPKPKMAALAIPEWGVEMQAAEGAKLGEFEKGDDLPGTAKIEGACGEEEIEIYRHDGNTVDEQFKNSTSGTEHDPKYPVKDKTDTGFKIKKTWSPPIGQVWSGEAAVVIGKHTYLCGLGTLMGVDDEALADCAIEACSSITEAAK